MFNLNESITAFNQRYAAKIKSNKTWGLVYLQPNLLAFLNQCSHLIQDSVYYASPFVTDRKQLRANIARAKHQPLSEALPMLQNIVLQLKTDQSILQRLNWEEQLSGLLNNKLFWEERLAVGTHPLIQRYLTDLQAQWKIHQPFQYHSSQALLFLLNIVCEYHYHFTQAHQELQAKQAAWLSFLRIPNIIAEGYHRFLEKQLNHLKLLKNQVINALLLRLSIAEQQNQVTCDDISYFLAQESQRLDSPTALLSLPQQQIVIEPTTFNKIHRAIEKHGNVNQKKQLYQLAWYEYGEFNSEAITVVTLSPYHLLAPKPLLHFFSKKDRKLWRLFTNNKVRLAFLEAQQALLAQLALPVIFAKLSLDSVSIAHPTLRSLTTRYQLLQQSLQSLNQQPTLYWWQWQQKRWKKAWHGWISEQLWENQTRLSDCLADFYQHVQNREDLLNQTAYCEKLRCIIQPIQRLIDNSPSTHKSLFLTAILERLSALIQEKNNLHVRSASESLLLSFRQDLLTALSDYLQHYHSQGETVPEHRYADFDYLRNLLRNSNDVLQLREAFNQRFLAMQPALLKWIPALDSSFLRRRLKAVLENPKYSMEQLKQAVLSQADKSLPASCQGFVFDINDREPLTTEEEVEQLEKRIRLLINHTECTHSFFRELPKNEENKSFNFFKSLIA